MNILYLGANSGTSLHRANALRRLGHYVSHIEPETFLPRNSLQKKFHWETGGLFIERQIAAQVVQALEGKKFDFTLVNSGRYVGPLLIEELKKRFGPVVNYNNDDPYGKRDRYSWLLYRKSVPNYDMVVVLREPNVSEAYKAGAKKVLVTFFSADEVAHAPRELTANDHKKWDSEVLFVGTWMPERGPFMAQLLKRGVPLSIYGSRWDRSPEWSSLQSCWRGPATRTDDEYAKVIQCSKVTLGLLSRGNRDLHTQRSLEIPALKGLFCAERTTEHLGLYQEGEEAVFWSDADECADWCFRLLNDESRRREIVENGHKRCQTNNLFNEAVMARILAEASRN